jgi:membrane-bound lytic murein transglycosylase D
MRTGSRRRRRGYLGLGQGAGPARPGESNVRVAGLPSNPRKYVYAFILVSIALCWMPRLLTAAEPAASPARPAPPVIEGLPDDWEKWMRENIDDDVMALWEDVDIRRVQEVFSELFKKFEANDVYDLASARDAVIRLLPVLKQFEETLPYAAWLETRLDYLDVAQSLRREVKVVSPEPGVPPIRPPPPPELQRKMWETRLAPRPWPASAQVLVPRLKPIFRSVGVPAELIWLAEVESSFNPKARSPKGAAGLFQLMPTTARALGLSLWPFDDRLDADSNARAAAKYLRHLYTRFGDWRLVLAAYNAGETRVSGLLASAKSKTFQGIAAKLPAETQMYVPRLEATLRKREGVALMRIGSLR